MAFLILTAGIVCGAIVLLINRKNTTFDFLNIALAMLFYASLFCFIYYLPKVVFGKGSTDAFGAICDVGLTTFKHFAVIYAGFGVCCIIATVLIKPILNRLFDIAKMFWITAMSSVMIFSVFRWKSPTCMEVLIILCISYMYALFYVVVKGRKVILVWNEENRKSILISRLKTSMPIVMFWATMMFLCLPHELIYRNKADITLRYGYFIVSSIVCILVIATLIEIILLFIVDNILFDMCCWLIMAVTLIGYIQELFLNGEMGIMAGISYNWGRNVIIINAIVWILLLGIIITGMFKLKGLKKWMPTVCGLITLMRVVTLIVVGMGTEDVESKYLTKKGALELARNNNVIVFVLDFYDSQTYERALGLAPEASDELCDFTYYDNLSSNYALTHMEVPFLLTDTEWEYDMTDEDYVSYAWSHESMPADAADEGYSVGLYTEGFCVDSSCAEYIVNYEESPRQDYSIYEVGNLMIKSSKYKAMPYAFKNDYYYTTDDFARLTNNEEVWNPGNDLFFYNDLISDGLSVGIEEKAFRFYHMQGAHSDYKLDENIMPLQEETDNFDYMDGQAAGSLRIVLEYIRQLKQLGLYDDSTIIITADHGHNFEGVEAWHDWLAASGLEPQSNPICFVKMPYESHAAMVCNDMPASQKNLNATMRSALGLDAHKDIDGKMIKELSELVETDNSVRKMIFRRVDDVPYREYEIRGNVHNFDNWELIRNE